MIEPKFDLVHSNQLIYLNLFKFKIASFIFGYPLYNNFGVLVLNFEVILAYIIEMLYY
jgi:hypothetical protein